MKKLILTTSFLSLIYTNTAFGVEESLQCWDPGYSEPPLYTFDLETVDGLTEVKGIQTSQCTLEANECSSTTYAYESSDISPSSEPIMPFSSLVLHFGYGSGAVEIFVLQGVPEGGGYLRGEKITINGLYGDTSFESLACLYYKSPYSNNLLPKVK